VNKKGLPVWKLAYSFSVYIILPENTQTTFLKTRIKATEVGLLATSAGHLKY
jgi:hypothetical protein